MLISTDVGSGPPVVLLHAFPLSRAMWLPQVEALCDRCQALGLMRTGSSDFHGPHRPGADRFRAFELHGRTPELGILPLPPSY